MDLSTNDVAGSSSNQRHATPPRRCAGGCGFFGTADKRGFCSYCYKNYLKDEEIRKLNEYLRSLTISESDTAPISESDTAPSRCGSCRRKLGLIPFRCRCGGDFCNTHRHPEAHACSFDFKKAGTVVIEKQNPSCKADKLTNRI